MPFVFTVTFARINPQTPSAWDAAAAHHLTTTGRALESLDRTAQIAYVRSYVNR